MKKIMEFSIKLTGWVLDDLVFQKEKQNVALKCFILSEILKQTSFSHYDPP